MRAGRRTNLALLGLLCAALATGGLAYSVGTGWVRWVVVHGVVGLAIVALAPWKSVIARSGVRQRRPGWGASLALSGFVAVALVFGVLHATGLARSFGAVTAMQVHVAAALLAVPLAAWHVVVRRVRPRTADLSRRNVLRAGVLLAEAGAGYAALAGVVRATGLTGATRRGTGSYRMAADEMPVTQWLDDGVPSIDAGRWRLRGPGRTWTYDQLAPYTDRVRATIDCTGGWYARAEWEGVRVRRLVGDARGRSVVVRSATGYSRRFPLRDADSMLLATRAGGELLDAGHGFPARLVAPGRRGFCWVKWVTSIEVSDAPSWWQPPFPLT